MGTVAACFGREPDPVAALVFVRFFDLAMSPLRAHRAPDCLCAQLLGVPGYLNSMGSALIRVARRARITMTTTPISVTITA